MSFKATIEFIESVMVHRKPHHKGLDHGCAKCLLRGALAMESGQGLSILPDGSIVPFVKPRGGAGKERTRGR